eukprot:jgi/Bigna1/76479/fgenesh1_pg.41_\
MRDEMGSLMGGIDPALVVNGEAGEAGEGNSYNLESISEALKALNQAENDDGEVETKSLDNAAHAISMANTIITNQNSAMTSIKNSIEKLQGKKASLDSEVTELEKKHNALVKARDREMKEQIKHRRSLENQIRSANESLAKSEWLLERLKMQLRAERNISHDVEQQADRQGIEKLVKDFRKKQAEIAEETAALDGAIAARKLAKKNKKQGEEDLAAAKQAFHAAKASAEKNRDTRRAEVVSTKNEYHDVRRSLRDVYNTLKTQKKILKKLNKKSLEITEGRQKAKEEAQAEIEGMTSMSLQLSCAESKILARTIRQWQTIKRYVKGMRDFKKDFSEPLTLAMRATKRAKEELSQYRQHLESQELPDVNGYDSNHEKTSYSLEVSQTERGEGDSPTESEESFLGEGLSGSQLPHSHRRSNMTEEGAFDEEEEEDDMIKDEDSSDASELSALDDLSVFRSVKGKTNNSKSLLPTKLEAGVGKISLYEDKNGELQELEKLGTVGGLGGGGGEKRAKTVTATEKKKTLPAKIKQKVRSPDIVYE